MTARTHANFLEIIRRNLKPGAAIPFSGGLDSSVLLALTGGDAITVGFGDSEDMGYAKRAFPLLSNGRHAIHQLEEAEVKNAFAKCLKLAPGVLKAEILVPAWITCAVASGNGIRKLAFGSGAEEIFLGYEKFFGRYEKMGEPEFLEMQKKEIEAVRKGDCELIEGVCKEFGISASFPYLNAELIDAVFAVPLEERIGSRRFKKLLLRQAAREILPNFVLFRPKRAVQYGSGVHKFLSSPAFGGR